MLLHQKLCHTGHNSGHSSGLFSSKPAPVLRSQLLCLRAQKESKEEVKADVTVETEQPSTSSFIRPQEKEVDKQLEAFWEDLKRDLKKDLKPEEAQMLDTVKYEELLRDDNTVFRRMAEQQLGPVLAQLGLEDEDPLEFFFDLIKIATFMQFVTCGMAFYSTELLANLDTGEAFRVACGLAFGYMARPFFKVEQLLWPLYTGFLEALNVQAVYQVEASQVDKQSALNGLGVVVASAFFLPQVFFGWHPHECIQLVVPMSAGLFLFDITYMMALLLKLRLI